MFTGLDDFLAHSAKKKQVIGTWGFNSNVNFQRLSTQEANVWFFEQVFNFLRAFFGLVTPDSLEVVTYNATQQIKKESMNSLTFLDELMLIMKGLKEYIWTLKLNLNIIGFLRTQHDPDNPVRLQIQEPCSFIAWGGPDETGFQNFSITYSLFSEAKMEHDEQMVWSMNQPLLEKALKKWEKQSGRRITVVNSSSSDVPVFQHGFREPKRRSRTPPPNTSPPPPDVGGGSGVDFNFV